jgi:energy-converting hydrogenase B subunit D
MSGVRHAVPTVLLIAGVALEVIAVVGVSVMRNVLDRLHYVSLTALQAVALLLVVAAGTAIVFVGDPLRQTLVLSIYGLALTLLFFLVQAPDVALSELVVGAVGMPVIILAALRKIAQHAAEREREEEGGK